MGELGALVGRNFYAGTQNGSKLDLRLGGLLIHTFELEVWPPKVFP